MFGFTIGGGSPGAGSATLVPRKYINVPRLADPKQKNILSRTAFCKITVFHYTKQNFGPPSDMRDAIPTSSYMNTATYDVTDAIAGMTVNKNMSQPSGEFEFLLFPTSNWKSLISPGDWVVIYMYGGTATNAKGNDSKDMLTFGNVDRVARVLAKEEESDKTTLRFKINGRNFGKIFETTDVFFDPYVIQGLSKNGTNPLDVMIQTAGLNLIGTPDDQVNSILDIFIGGGAQSVGFGGATSPLKQWLLPQALASLFPTVVNGTIPDGPCINDILQRMIDRPLPGYKVDSAITPGENGDVFELLKRNSNDVINELFFEEIRLGDHKLTPSIIMRPRPLQSPFFANNCGKNFSKVNEHLGGMHKSLQQLAKESFLELSPTEIVHENLGKDDHTRFNFHWFEAPSQQAYLISAVSGFPQDGVIRNPMVARESVKRHGLRRYQQMMEFAQPFGSRPEDAFPELLQAFMAQIYDQNFANHLYESGTIECSGVLEAELGKALIILPYRGGEEKSRIFYIEGYEHHWTYPSKWTTTFTLTHGQFLDDSNPFIDESATDKGSPDEELIQGYLSQSNVSRP